MDIMGIAGVASITVICYLLAIGIKATELPNKWIPVCCGGIGAFLGFVGWYFVDGFPADDILTALAIGIVSGLAATGANQIWKQLGGPSGD